MLFSKKKQIPLLFISILYLFTFTCNILMAKNLTDKVQQFLKEKGTIIFISQTKYPPFEFLGSDDNSTGMCVELARWISTEYGFKTLFKNSSFKQAQDEVQSGEADVITSLFYSEKRDQSFCN